MIFTFYSYKGGVGRSMALANVAAWLRDEGLRVAMLDWDLEAPGLESFFFESGPKLDEIGAQIGVIDTLMSYRRVFPRLSERLADAGPKGDGAALERKVAILDESLPPITSALSRIVDADARPGAPELLLLTAGLRAKEHFATYAHNVQAFNWDDFYDLYEGHAYFEWMRRQLLAQADVVLIDSRTGVNEMSGVCAQHLADVVVSFCAPNLQNLNGVAAMAASFSREALVAERGRRIEMVLVPTRVDNFSPPRINEFEERFAAKTASFTPDVFRSLKATFWTLKIPYAPAHSYREDIVIGDLGADKDLVTAYKRLAAYLAMLAPPQSRFRRAMRATIDSIIGRLLPTVVVLHAREADGLAQALRQRLEEANLPVWPDPDPTAGADPRAAVSSILEQSRYVVITFQGGAAPSPDIRAGWRRARQLGLTIVPVVTTTAELAIVHNLPEWMARNSFLALDRDWDKLVAILSRPSTAARVPLMAPDLAGNYVQRARELQQLKDLLLYDRSCPRVALFGMRGSGKSALASAFAADDEVQSWFIDGILWASASSASSVKDELGNMYVALTGEAAPSASAAETASKLADRLSNLMCLIVLDGLEDAQRLREFPIVPSCRYLILTRDRAVAVAAEAAAIHVGPLLAAEAAGVLAQGGRLTGEQAARVIDITGTLPMALKIASAVVAAREKGEAESPTPDSAGDMGALLERVSAGIDAGLTEAVVRDTLDRLERDDRERAADLAFTAAAGDLDTAALSRLWKIDAASAARTLNRLADLGLVTIGAAAAAHMPAFVRRLIATALPDRDIDRILEAAYAEIPDGDAARARGVVCRLVRLTEALDIEPRTVPGDAFSEPQLAVIPRLTQVGIVVARRDGTDRDMVALAHAAACRQWRRLRDWVESDREFLTWRQRLGAYIVDWRRTKDEGALLTRALLAEAVHWVETRRDDLSSAEAAYIERSAEVARAPRLDETATFGTATPVSFPTMAARRTGGVPPVVITWVIVLIASVALGIWWLGRASSPSSVSQASATPASITPAANEPPPQVLQGDRFVEKNDIPAAIRAYTEALAQSPNDADIYYKRATAHEAAGQSQDAINDLQRIVALSTDPLAVRAAQARLTRLGAGPKAPEEQTTVYLHYQSSTDTPVAEAVGRVLGSRGFRVAKPELVPVEKARTNGDVRFVPQDKATSYAVQGAVESALADQGYNLKMESIPLSKASAPAVKPGRIEVWLPPLSRPQALPRRD